MQVSDEAKDLISKIFKYNPRERIKLENILDHPFFMNYAIPEQLNDHYLCHPPRK